MTVPDSEFDARRRRFLRQGAALSGAALLASVSPPLLPAAPAVCATPCFAIIGDYGWACEGPWGGCGTGVGRVADLVNGWSPHFVITTGDNHYELARNAREQSDCFVLTIDDNVGQFYHRFIHPYKGRYGPGADVNRFFPALGNHDWGEGWLRQCYDSGQRLNTYLEYFTLPGNGRYYDFTWDFDAGPVHLFALDSDPREPDGIVEASRQALWLQTRLAASSAPWKLVYFHHAPYTSGVLWGTETSYAEPRLRWPFQRWGASAVIAGHSHTYERLVLDDNLPYFVNGLGGAGITLFGDTAVAGSRVRYNESYGAMKVTPGRTALVFEFFNVEGSLIDRHTVGRAPAREDSALPTGAPSLIDD